MFEIGDKVRYTHEYIRENCETGVDKLCAVQWRGKILDEIGVDIYEVVNTDWKDEVEDISGHILEIAED